MTMVPCWCFRGFDGEGAVCPDCNGTAEIPANSGRVHRFADRPRRTDGAVVVGGAPGSSVSGAPAHRFGNCEV